MKNYHVIPGAAGRGKEPTYFMRRLSCWIKPILKLSTLYISLFWDDTFLMIFVGILVPWKVKHPSSHTDDPGRVLFPLWLQWPCLRIGTRIREKVGVNFSAKSWLAALEPLLLIKGSLYCSAGFLKRFSCIMSVVIVFIG